MSVEANMTIPYRRHVQVMAVRCAGCNTLATPFLCDDEVTFTYTLVCEGTTFHWAEYDYAPGRLGNAELA